MQNVSSTRMELLARKAQIALALRGRDLLEQKRGALIKQFLQVADAVMEDADVLESAAQEARYALGRAEAIAGPEAVHAACLSATPGLPLHIETVSVMGVKVPRIEQKQVVRSLLGRGYSLTGTSVTIDEAALAFEDEVDAIIRLAESQLWLMKLATEIRRTARQLNVLDSLLIPRLESERDHIRMALDERERSDHFRLKLVKRGLERKRESSPP